ncbi:GNAT superfamily N-acetyltransferase [Rhodobium orientis]|uniref:GNAT family N-acetyltransferase n=1 Tax=Rhodobium orientis TaxID=34017 RepID=A0A327JLP9_9HYPH|nr:GNAT family N-acetyltransferase [Rhodobium orientis]MBB4305238.1 GNAT superfamily N-acetyltransferase [Rhodobium orientis]MBK5952134.1 GNAT family N-acetyltransferase [Rhodobium orientis]RAI26314.1 GNAT family N-acetyltransferase [Rhodobium orientis]
MTIRFRSAQAADLPVLIAMIAADSLAASREGAADPDNPAIRAAFEAISADPNNDILVAERDGTVIGCLQLTFIPGLTYEGGTRAHIEAVRVAASERGQGIGQKLVEEAISRARTKNCALVQLTTDRRRADAARFFERLGFAPNHIGMKLWLR